MQVVVVAVQALAVVKVDLVAVAQVLQQMFQVQQAQ
jgi:hypothetical protein